MKTSTTLTAPKAAVIGDPISHSLSPKLHNFWLNKYKISGSYEAILVKNVELANAVKSMVEAGYAGFNVTIPHKEKIFQLIKDSNGGEISNGASFIKAINTVAITPEGQLHGYNSDEYGFAENLKLAIPKLILKEKNAFIIGAGGAARAAIFSLLTTFEIKNIFITNRSQEKFQQIKQDFNQTNLFLEKNLVFLEKNNFENELANCDILINCSSLGMQGQPELQINLNHLKKTAIVYDIIYKPLITNLLKTAQSRGNQIVTGLAMLAFQGALGFEKWFGKKPEIDQELLKFLNK